MVQGAKQVVVVGGGVSGLGSALALARAGHVVTVVERDDTPTPTSADEAFWWDRRGAPQVRHSHAFLARLRNLLRDQYPDVLDALLHVGAHEIRFAEEPPPAIADFRPAEGDEDLVMLACRRTTFEWVLRQLATREGQVTFLTGDAVCGLLADPASRENASEESPPVVRGVQLASGTTLAADLVVVAAGRRSALPEWFAAIGAGEVHEEIEDTGIVYFSRFYRLREGQEYPPRTGAIGGDLGYLKYGVFAGDNRTFSVTLAAPTADDELRRLLADPEVFDRAARSLVATAPWLDGRAEPITPQVHVMAGLLNRWRELVVDGTPLALGVHAVGDAQLCTNPLYGRGCTTGFWHAHLMAQAVAAHPDDLLAQAVALDDATREHLLPWYRASVHNDAEARRVSAALLAGEDPDDDPDDPRTFMRGVFRDGLLPAVRTDQVVMRAFVRTFNLLQPPDSLMTDADVGARVLAVWQQRDERPPEPPLGPASRAELLGDLGVAAA
jgi:2-polyprenyl-6-methoxyphenol hydroxylase-like FAD-dependent oxidoreductase